MTHWSTQNQAAPCIGEEEDTRAGAQGTATQILVVVVVCRCRGARPRTKQQWLHRIPMGSVWQMQQYTGVLHRLAGASGARAHGPASAAGHLPRRLPGAPPDAARRAARGALVPRQLCAGMPPHRRRCIAVDAARVLCVLVRGASPPGWSGVLFACLHRMLLDPIFLSATLGCLVAAVTYSLSRLSEFLSPIRTVPNGLPKNPMRSTQISTEK
jgi:hypothetical protein